MGLSRSGSSIIVIRRGLTLRCSRGIGASRGWGERFSFTGAYTATHVSRTQSVKHECALFNVKHFCAVKLIDGAHINVYN